MCYSRFSAINSRPLEFITRSSAAPTSGLRGWATSSWRGDNNKQDFRSNSVTPASLTNRTQHYQQRRLLWTWTGRQLQQHTSWGSKNGELQTSNSSRNNTEHQQQTTNNRWAKINTEHSDERSANCNGWHTQDPTFALQQKNLQEHYSSQHQQISRSSYTSHATSREERTTSRLYDQQSSWRKQHTTSTVALTAVGQDA